MKFTFVALKKSQPNVLAARSTNDDGQADRDPQAAEHAPEDLPEVARPADLAVQGGAPVRVEDPEHHQRQEQERAAAQPEVEGRAAGHEAVVRGRVDDRRVVGVRDAEQARGLALSKAVWNVSCDDTSMSTNMTARTIRPIQMHHFWTRA